MMRHTAVGAVRVSCAVRTHRSLFVHVCVCESGLLVSGHYVVYVHTASERE